MPDTQPPSLRSAPPRTQPRCAAYAALEERFRRLTAVDDTLGLLQWDTAVMMPAGGAEGRANQTAALAGLRHALLTAPDTAALLDDVAADRLDSWQQANLAEMRRAHAHATAVPAALVEALSLAAADCERTWRAARPASDFAAVAPKLGHLLGLVREEAAAKAAALGVSPYDALLDQYEPGGRVAEIDRLFATLESVLPGLAQRVLDGQGPPPAPLPGPFDRAAQERLARRLMTAVGFDFDHGRLDVSAHPFCGGAPWDVRITTRYDEADFLPALMGVLHETGHGLYERGLPAAWSDQPVGRARGMSIHESQSLLVEMLASRSAAFLGFAAPLMRETFGGAGPAWSDDAFTRRAQRVERGFIRVDADEVTYPLHVILRTRLERAMIAGDLEAADLPGAWNETFERLMGVPVPDDRHGCLQDIHWYDGAWGYFPTYTLGALTAAQLFEAAIAADPAIPGALAGGDFAPLLAWLRPNVHALGSSLPTPELIVRATGRPLGTEAFCRHLERRYLS
jgi:carboxypeptidase Taq